MRCLKRLPRPLLLRPAHARHRPHATAMGAATADALTAANVATVAALQPQPLWRFFAEVASLPRPSKQEERVLAYLKAFADARSLPWRQDAVGNILISRPGSGGGENAPACAVQGHVDVVCEKGAEARDHDFTKTGVTLVIDGDTLKAKNTTLGADNGIGVAAALALLDAPSHTPLPPLQALFTVDEETGLTGAFGLDAAALGLTARTMLNLDTEDWGEIFIGCAGGGDTVITLPVQRDEAAGASSTTRRLLLHVSGLAGGHSGLAIGDGRGNALKLAARLATAASGAAPGLRIVTAAGGDKRNAIPRDCVIVVAVPDNEADAALSAAAAEAASLAVEYGAGQPTQDDAALAPGAEPGLDAGAVVVEGADARLPAGATDLPPLSAASSAALLTLLTALPHGVVKMSAAVPGLVETSTNLAAIKPDASASTFTIQTSTRSSHGPALEAVRRSIRALAAATGATASADEAYPGWAPAPSSPVLELTRAAIAKVIGRPPAVKCIHAGLECGILGGKIEGDVDCVSFGPTITGAHTPDEACAISTVAPFWTALLDLMATLAARKE